jgi:DNA-directed RNA polymerase delta subunit
MPENLNAQTSYDAVLQDLYAKRDEIETAISAILFLQGSGASVTPASGGAGGARAVRTGVIPSNAFFGMGLVDAAKKYIELSQAKRTLAQIVQGLQDGGMPAQKPNTVYSALRRREGTVGDIMRVGEEWGLKDWFAGVSIGEPTKAANGKKTRKRKKKSSKKRSAAAAKTETADTVKPEDTPAPKTAPPKAKPISILNAAHAVLDKEGAPLHAEVLAERINKGYGKTTNLKSLAASLPGDSTKRFDNIGNNTWVLGAWPDEKKKTRPVAVAATA